MPDAPEEGTQPNAVESVKYGVSSSCEGGQELKTGLVDTESEIIRLFEGLETGRRRAVLERLAEMAKDETEVAK